jgi:hypothetical protein
MKTCPSCKKEISPKAETCPACGHPIKKKTSGCAWLFLIAFVGIMIMAAIGGSDGTTPKPATPASTEADKIYSQGDTVNIGYTSYVAWSSYWTDRLTDNQYSHTAPDAKYLVVKVTVRNDDSKERSIPPFKLIDSAGREYSTSSNGYILDGHIGALSSLNPDVQKDGFIVFDCPPGRDYKLQVRGGYWSSDSANIELNPK